MPRPAAPALAGLCLSAVGIGMVLTPPGVPAFYRSAGLTCLAIAGAWMAFVVLRMGLARKRLWRAHLVTRGQPVVTARLSLAPTGEAELAAVKAGSYERLSGWPGLPEGSPLLRGDRPGWRIPILPPPRGFMPAGKTTLQAEVFVDETDPRLVVIRTPEGVLLTP